jgi:mRNA interferase HigB
MRIISIKKLKEFWLVYPDAQESLRTWYKLLSKGQYQSIVELRKTFPKADSVGRVTVFKVKGNSYRLLSAIHYNTQTAYILEVLTHGDYDKGSWKEKYQIHD